MKVLVTGATGFVGRYLIEELACEHEIVPTAPRGGELNIRGEVVKLLECDISEYRQVESLVSASKPDAIVHLAGISHVQDAEKEKSKLSEVNVIGTHNLCCAGSKIMTDMVFLFISTGLVYSGSKEQECSESTPVCPVNSYAMTKLAAEYVVRSFDSERFHSYIVRPFNHTGPFQTLDFVCPALARRIVEAKENGVISVGNLDAIRDFTDVRDIVKCYRKIIEMRPEENLFVLGSGQATSIRSVLEHFIKCSGKNLEIAFDPNLMRSNDKSTNVASAGLAKTVLDWKPQIPFETTLNDLFNYVVTEVNKRGG